jgi:Lipocalin-like domain
MKMKTLRHAFSVLSLASVTLLIQSCGKEDAQPSVEQRIAKTWIMSDMTATISGQTESVYADNVDPCMQDDEYTFTANGAISVFGSNSKCDPDEPNPISTGSFSILDGGKKISINADGTGSETFDLDELTATSLKVSQVDNSLGIPIKIVLIYRAK